jgi:hypothetical protein
MGWSRLTNGKLVAAAEDAGFEALVTTDQGMRHQQNLARRRLGVLVLPTNKWSVLRRNAAKVAAALDGVRPGEFCDVSFDG